MHPDADTGDLTGVDHLESAAGVQNTDHSLSRTSTVRGGHRVPVMESGARPSASVPTCGFAYASGTWCELFISRIELAREG
jgi:hypothetical protein